MSSAHRHNVLSAAINLWLHVEWPSQFKHPSPKPIATMRLFKAAFEEHYGHQAKDELEKEDVGKPNQAEETWPMGISLLATLLFLVAFSHENDRHEGKNDDEIEHVNNDKEEAEAWTSDMDILATIWSLMTYLNTHYGHQDEKVRTLKGSKDLPKKKKMTK